MKSQTALAGALFVVLGAFVFAKGLSGLWTTRTAAGWPFTSGTILTSKVTSSSRGRWTSYEPAISYAYSVEETSYTGRDVWTVRACTDDEAKNAVERFPTGTRARVYFDPADPSRAVLWPVLTRGMYLAGSFGALCMVGGAGILFSYVRYRRAFARRPLLDR